MNRHRFFIALAFLVLLATFGAAKWVTRWRPFKVGALIGGKAADWPDMKILGASDRYVIAGDGHAQTVFDLQAGRNRPAQVEGITKDGTALWQVREGTPRQLVIHRDGHQRFYAMPSPESVWMSNNYSLPQVVDAPDRVEVLVKYQLLRWNPASAEVQISVSCDVDFELGDYTVSRDGKKLVDASEDGIRELSPRTGRVVKNIALEGPKFTQNVYPRLSPFGSYALV